MRILITRHDRLGDFILAWPAIQSLALNLPDVEVSVLVNPAMTELARHCVGVQSVIPFPQDGSEVTRALELARTLRLARYDAAIALFSRFDLALGLWLARIPIRVAPATKVAQYLYNHRVVQHRSQSKRAEYIYNLELTETFLNQRGVLAARRPCGPYLHFPAGELKPLRIQFATQYGLNPRRPWVMIHAGHGGSAARPPIGLLACLANRLTEEGADLILSEGPQDHDAVQQLSAALDATPHVIYRSDSGLVEYARRLALADLFIGGSTGPLHLAGALDLPTVGFYPHRRSATSLRWQTLNSSENRLAFMPPPEAGEADLAALDVTFISNQVMRFFREVVDRDRVATKPRT